MLNREQMRSDDGRDAEEPPGYRRGTLRYRRGERCGYDAIDPQGQRVVLEVRSDAPALIEEARMMSAIRHQALAAVHDAGRLDDERWYVVLERWTGPSLESLLPAGPMDAHQVVALLAPLAPALDRLHDAGLTHLGLCAENLVVSDSDAPRLLIVGNPSGVAGGGSPDEADTLVLRAPEGLDYLAPDLLDGASRPDVYALSVLAFRLLSGGFPFRRYPTLTQTLVERQERAPASLAEAARRPMPPALEQWARKALAPEERRRPASAMALIADLAKASGGVVGDHEAALRLLLQLPARLHEPPTVLDAKAVRLDESSEEIERVDSIPPPEMPATPTETDVAVAVSSASRRDDESPSPTERALLEGRSSARSRTMHLALVCVALGLALVLVVVVLR